MPTSALYRVFVAILVCALALGVPAVFGTLSLDAMHEHTITSDQAGERFFWCLGVGIGALAILSLMGNYLPKFAAHPVRAALYGMVPSAILGGLGGGFAWFMLGMPAALPVGVPIALVALAAWSVFTYNGMKSFDDPAAAAQELRARMGYGADGKRRAPIPLAPLPYSRTRTAVALFSIWALLAPLVAVGISYLTLAHPDPLTATRWFGGVVILLPALTLLPRFLNRVAANPVRAVISTLVGPAMIATALAAGAYFLAPDSYKLLALTGIPLLAACVQLVFAVKLTRMQDRGMVDLSIRKAVSGYQICSRYDAWAASHTDSPFHLSSEYVVNPATGMMMVGGMAGLDAAGNAYGFSGTDYSSSHSPSVYEVDTSFAGGTPQFDPSHMSFPTAEMPSFEMPSFDSPGMSMGFDGSVVSASDPFSSSPSFDSSPSITDYGSQSDSCSPWGGSMDSSAASGTGSFDHSSSMGSNSWD